MEEELRFHLDMEAERLVREEGVDEGEARRRAAAAFGAVDGYRESMRDGRGLAGLTGLTLDVKLGARMLRKYPLLTAASVFALATAVALAAAWFEFATDVMLPRLPLPDGERIVQLRNIDLAAVDRDARTQPRSLHDFERWRNELVSVRDLSAYTPIEHPFVTENGRHGTLEGVRATPSLFRVAGVQPLLGRVFTEAEDIPGAPLVAVIGYATWQSEFDGDRMVLGRTIRLGREHATIIGVMPEGFGFPVNEQVWTPLRERAVDHPRGEGPPIGMVGTLAPGRSLDDAASELALIGRRTAQLHPSTHERLRPEVVRFGRPGWEGLVAMGMNVPLLFFLIVVSANVATLLFARTSTRSTELAMRSALGASRRRLMLQLVAESLVLTVTAAAIGLAVAAWGLRHGMTLFFEVQEMDPPFWFDVGLSAPTVVYVALLALIGALIIGGLPALRATGRHLRDRFDHPGAGGAGMRFGAVATGVIVVQVALSVAFIPVAIVNGRSLLADRERSGFPAESFLTARLAVASAGDSAPSGADHGANALDDAYRRLGAEPGVLAATRAHRLPGFNHPPRDVEIEGADSTVAHWARSVAVDPNFFAVMGAHIVAGRGLTEGDAAATTSVAVVDAEWARTAFGGNAVGRRFRWRGAADEVQPWIEVIGVVDGIEPAVGPGSAVRVFEPLRPREHTALVLYLRSAGPPAALAPGLLAALPATEGAPILTDLRPLRDVWRPIERSDLFFTFALAAVAAIILLFALMGIYALMAFTVAQRSREIGIRAAMGAEPARLLAAIFRRALLQIGTGVLIGAAVVGSTLIDEPGGLLLVVGVAGAIALMGLVGTAVPAARALRIQPIEALRTD